MMFSVSHIPKDFFLDGVNLFILNQSFVKAIQALLELIMQTKLALNSKYSCLTLPSAEMTGVHLHAWHLKFFDV
jgi:uncharacterized protein (DUF1919 family)